MLEHFKNVIAFEHKLLLLIKLFDRFDNIKTIFIKQLKRRQEIILETQQEFIPLAKYLNLPKIVIELNKL
ncbi:(p)ppGpp synthetase [Orientia tsutsugamushi]|uniref:(P)ppGpp synthetase n=1 Tax=Orientia tsutsugamushi TaxID=784 RepID=A0A2U3RTB8_ORITS|nr:spoT-like ppGpp hydrolase domain protein [Orientia tsutsugamushi str. Karp]SPR16463.1 (p)ppGpp synthetase [Orientia tsutsugamushi]